MTWYWRITSREIITVEGPDGNKHTLDWSDHKPDESSANGWTWSGDCPDPVYRLVADEDVNAALKNDIEQS